MDENSKKNTSIERKSLCEFEQYISLKHIDYGLNIKVDFYGFGLINITTYHNFLPYTLPTCSYMCQDFLSLTHNISQLVSQTLGLIFSNYFLISPNLAGNPATCNGLPFLPHHA